MSDDEREAEQAEALIRSGPHCYAEVRVAIMEDDEAGARWAMHSIVDDEGYPEATAEYATCMLRLAEALRRQAEHIEDAILSQIGSTAQVSWLGGDA